MRNLSIAPSVDNNATSGVAGRSRSVDVDRHVGARIRQRRVMLGLTVQQMAELIGVTYSQALKYEKGVNRIAGGRLYNIAQALGVDVGYFFEGLRDAEPGFKGTPQQRMLLELTRNFMNIPARKHQEGIVSLTAAVSAIANPDTRAAERSRSSATLREALSMFDQLTHEEAE